jgi:phosphoglycerate dehydrogenase-like enzyme
MRGDMKILIDVPVPPTGIEKIQAVGEYTAQVVPFAEEVRKLPKETIQDKEILFCLFPPENNTQMGSLSFVQLASAGYNQLLGLDLPGRGVRAANAAGVFDVPIAEWCMAMIINLARDLRGMVRNQEAGVWDRDARFQREVRGLKLGIWGYGGIGRETARLAKALGMEVRVLVRGPKVKTRVDVYMVPGTGDPEGILPDLVFNSDQRTEFLRDLDFLVLAIPLNPENRGILGEAEFQTLPDSAYLLNPARGPLVREEALLKALREGWIAGAALDTHYQYPMPAEHPLWQFPNVIMTPHISGSSKSPHFIERIWDIFLENLRRLRDNKPLLNEIPGEKLS